MNAADVLAEVRDEWALNHHSPILAPAHAEVAALLAHGEQGVAILPDGTLWALGKYGHRRPIGDDKGAWIALYRLVPLSAEAGDTDG